jgi:tetratricopeptide (TPR) repeat protein
MLNLCGIAKIEHAVGSAAAVRALKGKSYDVVLCEYDLGDGQDGQQLLEDLRHNRIISLSTIFIIVTAERSYEKVVSAAEFAPTDYILKPFTADTLLERIGRATMKRMVFMPIHLLAEQGHLSEAIEACMEGERSHARYVTDFLRLRAELYLVLGKPMEAEHIYKRLLETKAIAWARLGLAKSHFMQQKFSQAEELLSHLVSENRRYMDAYDWLAKTHEAIGALEAAKSTLIDAVNVSPHAVRRLRKLGMVAMEAGDLETAGHSFQKVIHKAKYSEFRDPEDHVRLVQALLTKGDMQQASSVIRDLDKSLGGLQKTAACKEISAAMLHTHSGNTERATEVLHAALQTCRETSCLSNDIKMQLAKDCLRNNLEEGATEVMLDVVSNTSDGTAMGKAMQVLEQAGRKDLAEKIIKESRRQVGELVSAGAEKAKQGDYRGAVELMTAAVTKLPNNPQVVFNAAVAVLKYLENNGWEGRFGEQAKNHIEAARRLDPANPRLVPLTELYQNIMKKYGIKPKSF